MSSKILVVDDAAMIQKVVEMTLDGHGFDLFRCLNLPELKKMLKPDAFQLILLDYSLSQELSGTELLKFIRSVDARVPIVVMVSVLEELNENIFETYKVAAKLEKPFRNQALIQVCRDYISTGFEDENEDSDDEAVTHVQVHEESQETTSSLDDLSDWVVDTSNTNIQKEPIHELINDSLWDESTSSPTSDSNHLVNELAGWGMEVPRKIGSDEPFLGDRPPVINDKKALNLVEETETIEELEMDGREIEMDTDSEEVSVLPADEDLSYPDQSLVQEAQPKSRLISLEELNTDDDTDIQDISDDDTDPAYNVLEKFGADLKEEIESEISPDDFWAAEETGSFGVESDSATVSGAIETTINKNHDLQDHKVEPRPVEVQISTEEIMDRLKAELTPMIEKWLNDNYKQAIERVAWEVIPDLAENLIRQEIKSISDSVKQ